MRELAVLVDGPRKLRWFWRDELEGLVRVLRRIDAGDQSGVSAVQPAPPSLRWLSGRLSAGDRERMTEQYLAGDTAPALAERYNISLKSRAADLAGGSGTEASVSGSQYGREVRRLG